jgi:hypothetical protein
MSSHSNGQNGQVQRFAPAAWAFDVVGESGMVVLWSKVYAGFLFAFCGFFRWIPYSFWFISVAPMRGGSHFLCCCKESNQRKQLETPAVTRSLATRAM